MRCSGPLINFVASFGLSPVVPCFSQVGGTRTVYNIPGVRCPKNRVEGENHLLRRILTQMYLVEFLEFEAPKFLEIPSSFTTALRQCKHYPPAGL